MIRLDYDTEPKWLDLAGGVRVRVAPMTTALMGAARSDPLVEELPENASQDAMAIALAKAIASIAIVEWEGVGDAYGEPVEPMREAVLALLDIYPIFESFQLGYVAKGLLLDSEKNASAPSPNGISAGATDTARPAPDDAPNAPSS